MKFKTPIAYAKPDKLGRGFTKENLKDLATNTKLPITVSSNFDYSDLPIGMCTALKVEDNKLMADIQISKALSERILNDSCFRVSCTLEPIKLLDISKIDKVNDVYEKDDK